MKTGLVKFFGQFLELDVNSVQTDADPGRRRRRLGALPPLRKKSKVAVNEVWDV